MHSTYGAQQITSVTELRQDTNDIIEHADETGEAILIQRNNEPVAILLSIPTYETFLAGRDQRRTSEASKPSESS